MRSTHAPPFFGHVHGTFTSEDSRFLRPNVCITKGLRGGGNWIPASQNLVLVQTNSLMLEPLEPQTIFTQLENIEKHLHAVAESIKKNRFEDPNRAPRLRRPRHPVRHVSNASEMSGRRVRRRRRAASLMGWSGWFAWDLWQESRQTMIYLSVV